MKEIKWLTICITSYNRPEYLNKLLDTIWKFPFSIKVIIADDKSSRLIEINEIIDYWSPKFDNNLTFYSNEFNLGEVENKNKMFSIVETEYLLLIGDDDLIKQDAFVSELEWFEQQQNLLEIYLYGYDVINNDGKVKKKRKSIQNIYSTKFNSVINKYFMNFVTFPFYYCHPAFYIIKTDLAKEIILDSSIGIGEDYDFLIRLVNNLDRVNSWVIRNKILFQWRKHTGKAENQSANIFNRFSTKFNIWQKYKNLNGNIKIKLRFFPFLVLPMYFDNYSSKLNKQQLNFVSEHNQILKSKFIKYSFLRFWPFKIIYNLFKIIEYAKVQILIFLS
ncbi:glycosyltransferase [Flavobacterium sp.]|uniref:glycosyltransferase family 2 protein n=1 Tax=Flavobacterium sp. TaxID=239 RepID=UPI00286F6AE4|nr:glycosyltransferase [Flavobacterium sp.]